MPRDFDPGNVRYFPPDFHPGSPQQAGISRKKPVPPLALPLPKARPSGAPHDFYQNTSFFFPQVASQKPPAQNTGRPGTPSPGPGALRMGNRKTPPSGGREPGPRREKRCFRKFPKGSQRCQSILSNKGLSPQKFFPAFTAALNLALNQGAGL